MSFESREEVVIGNSPNFGDYTVTIPVNSSGMPLTVTQPGTHVGHGSFVRTDMANPVTASSTQLVGNFFQAADGDTDGDKKVDNFDLANILISNSFGAGPGNWDWTQGDFDGDHDVDNFDIVFILNTNLFGTGFYAANAAVEPGVPNDGVVDLIVHPDGTAQLDTNGLTLDSFILESLTGSFSGAANLPFSPFLINTENEASASFVNLNGVWDLGQLFDPLSDLPPSLASLDIFYTIAPSGTVLEEGNCIGCVPEPSSLVLAVFGLFGLGACRWRGARDVGTTEV